MSKTNSPLSTAKLSTRKAPAGYRYTEVGIIPKDWETERIGKLASIATGTRNTQDRKVDGAYPFFVRSQQVERIDSCSFDCEAVLTAGDGVGTGKIFHYIVGKFDVHQRVYCIHNFSSLLDGRYFFYQFSTRFYDRVMSMTAKSSVDSVRMEMISDMSIPLPPLPEQRAIAEALSDVDAYLSALERLVAKKRAVKQGTMQALLTGRVRLPGFTGEWQVKRLGDVLQLQYGKSQKGVAVDGGSYPILATGGEIGRTDRYLYDKPSIIIGRKGTIGAPQYVDVPFWPIDTTFYAIISADNSSRFLHYLLSTVKWESYNEASGVPSLSANTVHDIEIYLPSFHEQIAIAAVLSDIDAEIEALERRRAKVQALKQGLMQELLTGRIRLVDKMQGE